MGFQLDGATAGSILVAVSILLTYLASQASAKAREDRRRLRRLVKRDIAWTRWEHNVQVWAAERGYDDLPSQPLVLAESEDAG
jgi:hypothetical protein